MRRYTILPDESLRDQLQDVDIRNVISTVCARLNVSEILTKSRKLDIVEARHIVHYILTINNRLSLQQIANITVKNHATVLHSRNVIEDYMFFKNYSEKINEILLLIINKPNI